MTRYADPDMLTYRETTELLGVSRKTVERWIEDGRLVQPLRRSAIAANPPQKRIRDRTPAPPCCPKCGTHDRARFTPQPSRPNGYSGYCKTCHTARVRRWRSEKASGGKDS